MLHQTSKELMQAYARYTPSGQPLDKNQDRLRQFKATGRTLKSASKDRLTIPAQAIVRMFRAALRLRQKA